jgi:hypothetical protein
VTETPAASNNFNQEGKGGEDENKMEYFDLGIFGRFFGRLNGVGHSDV